MQRKKTKHTPFGYSLFTNCSFDTTKNKLDCYRENDCMERFCENLRDHAIKIINYEEKEMIPITDKENKSYEKQRFVTDAKKNLVQMMTIKSNIKSEIIVITQENLEEPLIIFAI